MNGASSRLPSWAELARMPDAELDVELCAALVARDAYDDLDVRAVLGELTALGAPLDPGGASDAPAASGGAEPSEDALRARVLAVSARFVALGFRGNTSDYYDPKNSLLSDVLSSRTGLPITLSIVWCAMARRAGLLARGIAFPGQFLVRVDPAPDRSGLVRMGHHAPKPIVVDPFAGGVILDDEGTTQLLKRALGPSATLHPTLLEPAGPRITLVRLLTNLESTLAKRGEHARAFVAIDRIVTLVPDSARMLRERAALALRLGATEVARADLTRVVELEPQAPDIPQIRARLAKLVAPNKAMLH